MANRSKYYKADDFRNQMNAEYSYYVNGLKEKAISMLEKEIRKNPTHIQLKNSLLEIYKTEGMLLEANKLQSEFQYSKSTDSYE